MNDQAVTMEIRFRIAPGWYGRVKERLEPYHSGQFGFNDRFYTPAPDRPPMPECATLRIREYWYPESREVLVYDRIEQVPFGAGFCGKQSLLQNDKVILRAQKPGQLREFLDELGYREAARATCLEPSHAYRIPPAETLFGEVCMYLENIDGLGVTMEAETEASFENRNETGEHLIALVHGMFGTEFGDALEGSLFQAVARCRQ